MDEILLGVLGLEGWHVKGRDLSQHSFFCVGIENGEQEGRGLSGEEGRGGTSRQS